jgi:hypothetical protein
MRGENKWRKPDEYEYPAYKNIVKNHAMNILKKFQYSEEFGLILNDNKFRIIKTKNLFEESIDTRIKEKGKECKSYDKIELFDLQGKLIKTFGNENWNQVGSNQLMIEVRDIQKGIYTLQYLSIKGKTNAKLNLN